MESSGSSKKSSEKETSTDLVQLIKQLKDYIIIDRKDYEKLVQDSRIKDLDNSSSVIEALRAQNKLLEQEIASQASWVKYWKDKYKECTDELKENAENEPKNVKSKWWSF